MSKVIQNEVHDKDGNLLRIEVLEKGSGKHVIDILWDPSDEQTPENRDNFRAWASRVIRRNNLESVN